MLSKELIAQVRRLEIRTRKAVSEAFAGSYSSVFKGRGMAFSEVRLYQQGDDVRTIDWNVSARMQEPYVKVFTEERELTVMLLIDLSRSQEFGTIDKTKGAVAAEIAALLAFAATRNNDRVGAILFSDEVERYLPPKKGKKHVMGLMAEILNARPSGKGTDLEGALGFLGRVAKRRTIAFVLSDFLVPPATEKALRIASRRHDLVPVVVADPLEEALAPLGIVTAEDPETGRRVVVDMRSERVRRRYRRLVESQEAARRKLFRRLDLGAVEVRCGADPVRELASFFNQRRRRAG